MDARIRKLKRLAARLKRSVMAAPLKRLVPHVKRRLKLQKRLKPASSLDSYGLNDCEEPFREGRLFFYDDVVFVEKSRKIEIRFAGFRRYRYSTPHV